MHGVIISRVSLDSVDDREDEVLSLMSTTY